MFYLLLPCLSYIAGIFLYNRIISVNYLVLIYILLGTTLLTAGLYFFKRINIIFIAFISLSFCYFGAYWFNHSQTRPQDNDLYYYAKDESITNIKVEGVITEQPKVGTDKISFQFQPEIVSKPQIMLTSGNVELFIYSANLKLNYGDRIEVSGKLSIPSQAANPSEFDYEKYLKQNNIFSIISVSSEKDVKVVELETIKDFRYHIFKIKDKLLSTFYKNMPQDSASLVSSLVFGSKASPVPKDIQDDFLAVGLAHVLAASGMQISLIMTIGLLITKKLKINPIIGNIITALTIIFYMLITGLPPSILRAGLVNLLILTVAHKNQKLDSLKALTLISFALILYNPSILFDVGFEFSVLATFGLLYASPVIKEKITFLPDTVSEIIALIISAQLIVMPLQLYYFGQFSYLFLPANIIASIMVDLLTYLAIITLTFGLIIPFIAFYLGKILFWFVSSFVYMIGFLADLPNSVSYISRPSIIIVLLSYLIIFLIIELLRMEYFEISKLKQKKFYLLGTIIIFSLGYLSYNYFYQKESLTVLFANVRQGDSTIIRTPSGKNIIIDCGQAYEFNIKGKIVKFNAAEKYLVPYFRHNGINKIDTLVLTHPDLDHIGGCETILNNFEVKEVWDSGQYDDSKPYSLLLENILRKSIPIKLVNKGDNYKEDNLSFEVINDMDIKDTEFHSYNNNNAIALKLIYGKHSFLFTSDLEKEAEEKLINSGVDIKSDVYKVGHHGSKTSSTDEFISQVRPEISIASVGKNNRYGHPSKSVIERLEYFGSKVYRTDKDGGVLINTDGDNLDIYTSNK